MDNFGPYEMIWEMKYRYKGLPCTASHFDTRSNSWSGTAWPVAKDGKKLNVFNRAGREPCLAVAATFDMGFTGGSVINVLDQSVQDDSTRAEAVEHVAGSAGDKTLWTSWFGDPETHGSQLLRRQRRFGGRVGASLSAREIGQTGRRAALSRRWEWESLKGEWNLISGIRVTALAALNKARVYHTIGNILIAAGLKYVNSS